MITENETFPLHAQIRTVPRVPNMTMRFLLFIMRSLNNVNIMNA